MGILNTGLASETIARQTGDNNLSTQLTSEMNTRASQDANLNALINAGIREGGGVQFDIVPTQNSANGITSGGMYSTLRDSNVGFVDNTPTSESDNLITSGGIYPFASMKMLGHFSNSEVYNDCNDIPLGSIVSFTTFTGVAHAPETVSNYGGTILCLNSRLTNNICAIQICISSNIDWNNRPHMYFREYWGDGQGWKTTWQKVGTIDDINAAILAQAGLRFNGHDISVTDLNSLPLGTATSFSAFTGIQNAPPSKNGYGGLVLCMNARNNNSTCAIQIFVSSKLDYDGVPHTYVREYWGDGSGWGAWQRLANYNEVGLRFNGDNGQNVYTDLNDIPAGTVTRFVNFTNISNTPYGSGGLWYGGTVLCLEGVIDGGYGKTQLLFTPRVSASTQPRAYFRYYWGGDAPGWSDWQQFAKISDIDLEVQKLNYNSLSSFLRIGVVGDSFASGAVFMPNDLEHYVEYWSSSWVQQLARTNGSVGRNYAHSGVYCKTWLTDSYCKTKLENEDPCDLYYLALGINDSGHTSEQPLGSISDIHDGSPSQNADTFYGNYGRIIELIKSHAPYAHMIFSTMASNTGTKQTFNTAIEEIASHYEIPVIRQYEDSFFTSDYYLNHMLNGHPTVQVYSGMAKAIERLTKKCMLNNITYFNDIKPTSIGS